MAKLKALLKPVLRKLGLWGLVLRVYRAFSRWMPYYAAVALGLGFDTQRRLLPPTVLTRVIWVRVSSITHYEKGPRLRHVITIGGGEIWGGEWDLDKEPVIPGVKGPSANFRTMYQMFVENMPAEETDEYEIMKGEIRTQGFTNERKQLRTIEQAVEFLNGYRDIFNDIKENGYRHQGGLGEPSWHDEARIYIGRKGQLILDGNGHHRLAMAMILGIEHIPVFIRAVHSIWAERCFKKYGGGLLDAVCKGLDEIDCPHLVCRLGCTNLCNGD